MQINYRLETIARIFLMLNVITYLLSKISCNLEANFAEQNAVIESPGDTFYAPDFTDNALLTLNLLGTFALLHTFRQPAWNTPLALAGGVVLSSPSVHASNTGRKTTKFLKMIEELVAEQYQKMSQKQESRAAVDDPSCKLSGPQGTEEQMNTEKLYMQSDPFSAVGIMPNDTQMVLWAAQSQTARKSGGGADLYYKTYEDSQSLGNETPINSTSISTDNIRVGQKLTRQPVAYHADASFAVVWQNQYMHPYTGEGEILYYDQNYAALRVYDSKTGNFTIHPLIIGSPSQQTPIFAIPVETQPVITSLNDKYFIVAQSRYNSGVSYVTVTQCLSNHLSPENRINTDNTYLHLADQNQRERSTSIATLGANRFAVAWHATNAQASAWNVWVEGFEVQSSGGKSLFGGEFIVNTIPSDQVCMPYVASTGTGGFLVAWRHYDEKTGHYCIKTRVVNDKGKFITDEILVNTPNAGLVSSLTASMVNDKEFVVVWDGSHPDDSSSGIIQQTFDLQGNKTRSTGEDGELVNTYTCSTQERPSIVRNQDGGYSILWGSAVQDHGNSAIILQRFDKDGKKISFDADAPHNNVLSWVWILAITGIAITTLGFVWSVACIANYCIKKNHEHQQINQNSIEENNADKDQELVEVPSSSSTTHLLFPTPKVNVDAHDNTETPSAGV